MDAPWFLPEIHDLHPLIQDRIEALAALFPPAAAGCIAWSVVPDWQGRAPIAADAAFAARLAALPGTLVLHGFTHSLGPSLADWLLYGHDNRSEFAALGAAEAARRLDAGLAAFAAAGLARPSWFCAPRWQQSAATAPALAARGFAGWMGRGALHRTAGPPIPLPALNFDEGERAWKIALAALPRARVRRRLLGRRRPFRFVLHPADLDRPRLLAEIGALSARLAAEGWRARSLDEAAA
jgi:predicted deacetylase